MLSITKNWMISHTYVESLLIILLIISSISTLIISSLSVSDDDEKTIKKSQNSLLSQCNGYTFNQTQNRNLTCKQSILTHTGVEYLRSILPNTDEVDGLASIRILDSFTFTNSKKSSGGKSNCQYSKKSDGRHFPPLDLLQMRVIAEGVLNTIGSKRLNNMTPHDFSHNKFLISKKQTEYLSSSKDLGQDLHSVFKLAFTNRNVMFIGDSTTRQLYTLFVAWLITFERNNDPQIKQLLTKNKLKSQLSNETTTHRNMDRKQYENISSLKAPSSNQTSSTKTTMLTSPEARYLLGLGCNISKAQYKQTRYFGGRCAYRYRKCLESRGCLNRVNIASMNLTIASHDADGGSLLYKTPSFALNKLIEFEHSLNSNKTALKKNHSKDLFDIVIVTGGMHYLHLYPVRKYTNSFGLNLGNYESEMNESLLNLRRHLGKGKLVIWKTVNDICDELYTKEFRAAIHNYSLAAVL